MQRFHLKIKLDPAWVVSDGSILQVLLLVELNFEVLSQKVNHAFKTDRKLRPVQLRRLFEARTRLVDDLYEEVVFPFVLCESKGYNQGHESFWHRLA